MALLATDPIDLLIDPETGDIVVDTDLHFSSGLTGVAQSIRIALQMFKGEWFLDLDAGVPWLARDGVDPSDAILGQKPVDLVKASAAFRDAILSAVGVVSIRSLDVTFNDATRTLTATWVVQTAFGDTPADSLSFGGTTV